MARVYATFEGKRVEVGFGSDRQLRPNLKHISWEGRVSKPGLAMTIPAIVLQELGFATGRYAEPWYIEFTARVNKSRKTITLDFRKRS